MNSVHAKAAPQRWLHALRNGAKDNRSRLMRSWLRYPIEYEAIRAVEKTPIETFTRLFPESLENRDRPDVNVYDIVDRGRHAWNVRMDEEIMIRMAVATLKAKRIFEIGTFNGGTTLAMAQMAAPDARIWTLDLPPEEFDATQGPEDFKGSLVGSKFHDTPQADKITQLWGDSTKFDYSPYWNSMDFVFVDAAHDYEHGVVDSHTALKLARPGGVIFWHDFVPGWAGLVHGIREAAADYELTRLAGTSMVAVRKPE